MVYLLEKFYEQTSENLPWNTRNVTKIWRNSIFKANVGEEFSIFFKEVSIFVQVLLNNF